MSTTPTRAAAYLRLSEAKKGTVGESLTIADQRRICREYAERHGWTLGSEYVDDDTSAAMNSSAPRPGFEAMLKDLATGHVDGVVCRDMDRLSRTPLEQASLVTTCTMQKIPILTDGTVLEAWNPSGFLQASMLGAMSHFENLQKSKRMKEQARGDALRGIQYMKFRPFGYSDRTMTQLEKTESEAIRVGVDMLGQNGRYTLVDVAKKWNSMGLVTPRAGKPWNAANVRATITRPCIAGIVTYKDEVIDVEPAFLPIVSREAYEQMLTSLKVNAKGPGIARGTSIVRSPLRQLVKCGFCGGNLSKHGRAYRCNNAPVNCKGVYILSTKLEEYVFDYVARRIALMPSAAIGLDEGLSRAAELAGELDTIASERDQVATSTIKMASKLALLEDLVRREQVTKEKLSAVRSESALASLVADLGPWITDQKPSFQKFSENKKTILERMKELSNTQLNVLSGTFGMYTVRGGVVNNRVKIEHLDPFSTGYDEEWALEA